MKGLTIAIIGIALIIGFVAIYGAFAKQSTTTSVGVGGTTTVHEGALGWLEGIFEGLTVSLTGGGG